MALFPSAAAALHHTTRVIHDPDQFGDAVSGVTLKVEFQRRQTQPSVVEQFQTPTWGMDFGQANVKTCVHGIIPGGWSSLCLVRGPGDSTWNGHAAGTGTLCCTPPGQELDGRTAPGFSWMTVALSSTLWAECRAVAGLEDTGLVRFGAVTLSRAQLARLEREIGATRGHLHSSTISPATAFQTREATNLAMHVAITACELAARKTPARDSLRNRTRLARRAEAWMRDHLAECIRISDVCVALRVSRRELEYAFRSTYDQSPRDFLHILRLHAIRQALLAPQKDQTILEVAYAHGITHLSRFAADYRALFGVRPSEEAKRCAGEAGLG